MLLLALVSAACSVEATPVGPPTASTVTTLYAEATVIALYQEAIGAVVKILIVGEEDDIPEHQGFLIPNAEGIGSGMLIDSDGHILTNYHVIDDGGTLEIELSSGERIDPVLVGTAPENDLALLKVDSAKIRDITPLTLGDSDAL